MAKIYKNMIICERNCQNDVINFLKKYAWFDERKPFEYHNPEDKIILFYNEPIFKHEKFINIYSSIELYNKTINKTIDGIIKLYCDNNNIKVFYLISTSNDAFKKNMTYFKDYLIETIKICKSLMNIPDINFIKNKFTIYWDKNVLCNKKENILKDLKLLSSSPLIFFATEKLYIFTESDLFKNKNLNITESTNENVPPLFPISSTINYSLSEYTSLNPFIKLEHSIQNDY
jgi:hypothetical protein